MLELFKGHLSLDDILNMPNKRLVALRDARAARLSKEAEERDKQLPK